METRVLRVVCCCIVVFESEARDLHVGLTRLDSTAQQQQQRKSSGQKCIQNSRATSLTTSFPLPRSINTNNSKLRPFKDLLLLLLTLMVCASAPRSSCSCSRLGATFSQLVLCALPFSSPLLLGLLRPGTRSPRLFPLSVSVPHVCEASLTVTLRINASLICLVQHQRQAVLALSERSCYRNVPPSSLVTHRLESCRSASQVGQNVALSLRGKHQQKRIEGLECVL